MLGIGSTKVENEDSSNVLVCVASSLPVLFCCTNVVFSEKTSLLFALPFREGRERKWRRQGDRRLIDAGSVVAFGSVLRKQKRGFGRTTGTSLIGELFWSRFVR